MGKLIGMNVSLHETPIEGDWREPHVLEDYLALKGKANDRKGSKERINESKDLT